MPEVVKNLFSPPAEVVAPESEPTYPIPVLLRGRSIAIGRDAAVDTHVVEDSYDMPAQALQFDGTDGYVAWSRWAGLPFAEDIPTQDFSVSFYAYIDSMDVTAEGVTLIHFFDDFSNLFRVVIQTGNSLRFALRDLNAWRTVNTVTAINIDTWYHCVFTWDAGSDTVKLYINGSSEGSQNTDSVQNSGAINNSQIGRRTDGNVNTYFEGRLGNVAVWDSVLGAAEVSDINAGGWGFDPTADSGSYVSSSSLISWWDFRRESPDRRVAIIHSPLPATNGAGYGTLSYASGA